MTDKLNEQLSALLDNELSDHEASSVLAQLSQKPKLQQKWERYHIIRDVMRGEAVNLQAGDISERVKKQIDLEPAIISVPKKSRSGTWKSNWIKPAAGAALAASVATVAVINAPGILGLNESSQPITAANINSKPTQPVVTVANISQVTPTPVTYKAIPGTRWKNLKEPSLERRLNGYLVNHSEYAAPGTGIRVMPYASFVGYDSNQKPKPKR
jgi:sigma-E factor negative regulatory protein RseA